jgi:hypothetical protein
VNVLSLKKRVQDKKEEKDRIEENKKLSVNLDFFASDSPIGFDLNDTHHQILILC